MKPYPEWLYSEMKQVGVDYNDIKEVQTYDSRMKKLRNIKKETEDIINCVGLTGEQVVLEIGTGTGDLSIEIAKHCRTVYALDISPVMLEYARKKANSQGVNNIKYFNAGFLTYEHTGEPVDVIVSQLALHHLPDFWKLVALKRINTMLKKGGKFFLRDTVYSFEVENYKEFFNTWLSSIGEVAGEELALDTKIAIRDEFSTCDWIMEGLIMRAGFTIDTLSYHDGFLAVYVCIKK
ncbi:MAG: methyltransferase domain-containing protein [Desulfotomaculaceae bacterium]|nr:methyltransferase domain-containing protein [Desulfotomaculaceae bacterium]